MLFRSSRPPIIERNKKKISIENYSYSRNKDIKEHIISLRSKDASEFQRMNNKSFVQNESNKLIDNKKITNIISIFDSLDNDSDGKISAISINRKGILGLAIRIIKENNGNTFTFIRKT